MTSDFINSFKSKVKIEHCSKIDEICEVLDESQEYTIIKTANLAKFRIVLNDFKKDNEILDKRVSVLCGPINLIYKVTAPDGFLCCMLTGLYKNNEDGYDRLNKILIFQEENTDLFGGF